MSSLRWIYDAFSLPYDGAMVLQCLSECITTGQMGNVVVLVQMLCR